MSKYGDIAVGATELAQKDDITPQEAWNGVARTVFPASKSSQEKCCPRRAYLGLCEEGLVLGIPRGSYGKRSCRAKNKKYALDAIDLLVAAPSLVSSGPGELWARVGNGRHNSQMDVVLTLWRRGLIAIST